MCIQGRRWKKSVIECPGSIHTDLVFRSIAIINFIKTFIYAEVATDFSSKQFYSERKNRTFLRTIPKTLKKRKKVYFQQSESISFWLKTSSKGNHWKIRESTTIRSLKYSRNLWLLVFGRSSCSADQKKPQILSHLKYAKSERVRYLKATRIASWVKNLLPKDLFQGVNYRAWFTSLTFGK